MTSKPKLNPALKFVLDLGPLLVFFAVNSRFGIFAATGAFMAAIVIALGLLLNGCSKCGPFWDDWMRSPQSCKSDRY